MLRYGITDRALFTGSLDALSDAIVASAGKIDFLQIRERDLPAAQLERFTARVIAALSLLAERPRVLVNHRADVAMACGADGVHLRSAGGGELEPEQVDQIYLKAGLPRPLVSTSCHSLDEVAACRNANLILFGPVFGKVLPPPAEALVGYGISMLRQACVLASPVPVLALGGVNHANQAECLDAGAAGVAGIRMFFAE